LEHFELVVLMLLVAVAGLALAARAVRIPYPIFLVLGGLGLGFVPGVPDIALPPELPVEVLVPQAVRLRLSRRGETEVSRQEPAAAGSPEQGAGADGDLGEFVRLMSEQSRRIFGDMTEKVRHSGFDASGERAGVVGKPEEAFFRLALEDLGLEAGEVAMVGDDAEADVAGAKRAGLLGVQVKTGKWPPDAEGGEADLVLDSVAGLPEALGV